jgi:hypothetical protein
MNANLGIRAAVREAVASGSDHWTIWLDKAGLRFPQWYRSPQAACTASMSPDQRDAFRMRSLLRYPRGRWV